MSDDLAQLRSLCEEAKAILQKVTALLDECAEAHEQALGEKKELEAETKELRGDLNIAHLRIMAALGQKYERTTT